MAETLKDKDARIAYLEDKLLEEQAMNRAMLRHIEHPNPPVVCKIGNCTPNTDGSEIDLQTIWSGCLNDVLNGWVEIRRVDQPQKKPTHEP